MMFLLQILPLETIYMIKADRPLTRAVSGLSDFEREVKMR
jgi:hypothetical protein